MAILAMTSHGQDARATANDTTTKHAVSLTTMGRWGYTPFRVRL